jgi:hypothetical protein
VFGAQIGDAAVDGRSDAGGRNHAGELGHRDPATRVVPEISGEPLILALAASLGAEINIRGLALQPGDIVDVTHPSLPVNSKNLRIETLEYDENDHLQITASEYVPAAYI